jgi:acetolactate synthase-1/2/3 large subunit
MTGAEALVRELERLGAEAIFGLCGDTSLPLYEAFAESTSIRHVLTRDERCASFMADAYARLSGRVGVCEGPSNGCATGAATIRFADQPWIDRINQPNGTLVMMNCALS